MQSLLQNEKTIDLSVQIKRPNPVVVIFIALFMVLVIGITDYISGYEMSFSIFYLIPISFATLFSNIRIGFLISLVSALIWYSADILSNHIYSNALIPVWNAIMRAGIFLIHTFFLSKLLELYQKMKAVSLMDPLTNIPNWRLFREIFDKEHRKSKRNFEPFTLAYVDLDNFKKMNDTLGHSKGDLLLIMVARLMTESMRPSDTVARLGGDEFAILLPETDFGPAQEILNRLKSNILSKIEDKKWPVTLSIGAVTFKTFSYTIDEMVKQADDLMYEVKQSGKNNIRHSVVVP